MIDLLQQFNFLKMRISVKVLPTFSEDDGFGVRCQVSVMGDRIIRWDVGRVLEDGCVLG